MLNYCKGNEFDLHKNTQLNDCAPGLALKLRHAATRKWTIMWFRSYYACLSLNGRSKQQEINGGLKMFEKQKL